MRGVHTPSHLRGTPPVSGGEFSVGSLSKSVGSLSKSISLDSPSKIEGVPRQRRGSMTDVGRGSTTPVVHGSIPTFARAKNNIVLKPIRRKLRSNGTPAEAALWNVLKGRKVGGFRFRRQFSIGAYVLDFYCPLLHLAIELDGDYHYHCAMPEKDYSRMQKLEHEHGIKTLRFENKVVFENPNVIVAEVMRYAAGHTPPPLRGTSPVSGEELKGGQLVVEC